MRLVAKCSYMWALVDFHLNFFCPLHQNIYTTNPAPTLPTVLTPLTFPTLATISILTTRSKTMKGKDAIVAILCWFSRHPTFFFKSCAC